MPIQWPPVDRGPAFGTDCDVRDFAPAFDITNLGIIGADLTTDSLDPGIGIDNNTRAVNLRNLGAQFEASDQYTMAPPAAILPVYGRQSYQQTDWYRSNSALTGVTRDSTGAVLGTCEVVLYSTIDVVIGSQFSDASGNFSFLNPGTGPFYIVAYKPGAPDVAGTTVNTLLPTLL
jgi:hypothetical protein